MNYCSFNIEPYYSDMVVYHWCPQTLAKICRNMCTRCGFRAVAARMKYPGLILLDKGTDFYEIAIQMQTFSVNIVCKMADILLRYRCVNGAANQRTGSFSPLTTVHSGVGVTKAPLISLSRDILIYQNCRLNIINHVNICQVSPQLSCGNSC